jgi:hypothetical protein
MIDGLDEANGLAAVKPLQRPRTTVSIHLPLQENKHTTNFFYIHNYE